MEHIKIYELVSKKIPKENILVDELMNRHTSFKIGGKADIFIRVKNTEEIKYILDICNKNNILLTILGNGSNVLIKDNGIRGIVLKIEIDNIDIEECSEDNIKEKTAIVTVGAGVLLGKLAQILFKKSISGFEFASGIPGTIGGAIIMNAGAYGSEFKDIILETTCMNMNGEIFKLSNSEQQFEYRNSVFKRNKYIVLESKLKLKYTDNSEEIKNKMDEYRKSRIEKQPLEFPSAGSTFKRGADFITAKLIDECGLKNYQIGGAKVSEKHAGFVVNVGNATADDVLKLTEKIKLEVYNKFQKNIELEIEILGE